MKKFYFMSTFRILLEHKTANLPSIRWSNTKKSTMTHTLFSCTMQRKNTLTFGENTNLSKEKKCILHARNNSSSNHFQQFNIWNARFPERCNNRCDTRYDREKWNRIASMRDNKREDNHREREANEISDLQFTLQRDTTDKARLTAQKTE